MKRELLRRLVRLLPKAYRERVGNVVTDAMLERLDYDKADIFMYKGIRSWQCNREPDVVKWIESQILPGEVFYDIGANVGAFALIAAKYHKGKVKTYAFEPAYNNINELVQNILLNHCTEAIFPIFTPLSKEAVLTEFHYNSLRSGRGLHTLGAPKSQSQTSGERFAPVFTQLVETTTIDHLVRDLGLPSPNHIKLDVDGFEHQILQGAEKVLSDGPVKSVLVEIGDEDADGKIGALLGRHGFVCIGKAQRIKVSNKIYRKM